MAFAGIPPPYIMPLVWHWLHKALPKVLILWHVTRVYAHHCMMYKIVKFTSNPSWQLWLGITIPGFSGRLMLLAVWKHKESFLLQIFFLLLSFLNREQIKYNFNLNFICLCNSIQMKNITRGRRHVYEWPTSAYEF